MKRKKIIIPTNVELSSVVAGVGMEQEEVQNLFAKVDTRNKGIGLLNIDKRLQQLFSKGLTMTSEVIVGTTVTFSVPL